MPNLEHAHIVGKHHNANKSGNRSYFFRLQEKLPLEVIARYHPQDANSLYDLYNSETAHYLACWSKEDRLPQFSDEYLKSHPTLVAFRIVSSRHKEEMKLPDSPDIIEPFRNISFDNLLVAENK